MLIRVVKVYQGLPGTGVGSSDTAAQIATKLDTLTPVRLPAAGAVEGKANSADLHDVATSGSYVDLDDKPDITKAAVGLGNVDNTSDASKPVSTAQAAVNTALQNNIDGKLPLAGGAMSGDLDLDNNLLIDSVLFGAELGNSLDAGSNSLLNVSTVEGGSRTLDFDGGLIEGPWAVTDTISVPDGTADGHVVNRGQLNGKADKVGGLVPNNQLDLEFLQDTIAAMFQAGAHTNLSVNYDDASGQIDLTVSGGGGGLDQEQAEDIVGALVAVTGGGINVNYDDAAGTLTFSLTGESYTTVEKNKLANLHNVATSGSYVDLDDLPEITKAAIGLANVDNTSDANKPVSTAQAAANTTLQSNIDDKSDRTLSNLTDASVARVNLGLGKFTPTLPIDYADNTYIYKGGTLDSGGYRVKRYLKSDPTTNAVADNQGTDLADAFSNRTTLTYT